MTLFFILFCLVKIIIAAGAIVMLVMWPRAPGRVWLIVGFACLLASSAMFVLNQVLLRFAFRNVYYDDFGMQSWWYTLSQVFAVIGQLVETASPLCFLVATIVLGQHFRKVLSGSAETVAIPANQVCRSQPVRQTPEGMLPHRGNMLITMAIGSIAIWPMGIAVRIMADRDLKQIRSGKMDPEGKNLSEISQLIGIVTSLIFVASSVTFVIVIIYALVGPR